MKMTFRNVHRTLPIVNHPKFQEKLIKRFHLCLQLPQMIHRFSNAIPMSILSLYLRFLYGNLNSFYEIKAFKTNDDFQRRWK